MTQIRVTWTKEAVATPQGTIYRVNSRCQDPVAFPSAAVFVLNQNGIYQNVSSLADFVYYHTTAGVWRFVLQNAEPRLDPTYLGKTITISGTSIQGVLIHYDVAKEILSVASLTTAPPPTTGVLQVSNDGVQLTMTYVGTSDDAMYRSATCTVNFLNPFDADKHIQRQRERIISLLKAWKESAGVVEEEIMEIINV